MFAEQQRVTLKSTEELPIVFDGQDATIISQMKKYPEFWKVITISGHCTIVHKSQMTPA